MATHLRSWVCLLVTVALCCTILTSSVSAENHGPKNVQVALKAKWSCTPLLLEAGELLSKEWKNSFWYFTELWLQSENEESDARTAKDCLKKVIHYGRSLLSEPLASLFEFSLTLRSASPRLVLYRQLAEESLSSFPLADDIMVEPNGNTNSKIELPVLSGLNTKIPGGKCCWVDTGAALFFDATELVAWHQRPDELAGSTFLHPEIFEFDHIHMDSTSGTQVAILYGALGTECFRVFHLALVDAAKQGKITYVVRPVLPSGCESKSSSCGAIGTKDPVNLGGYGVELALKNMEYKAMDDSEV